MFEEIVIFITNLDEKQKYDIKCFIEEMKKQAAAIYAPENEAQLRDYLNEYADKVLLITNIDISPDIKDISLAVLGYGSRYSGNAVYMAEELKDISYDYLSLVYDRAHGIPHKIAETKRLIIREMCLYDLEDMYTLYSTLSDCQYIEQLYERSKEEEFTKNYIKHMYGFFQHGLWLVFEKESGQLVGRMGIENREIDGIVEKELGYLIGGHWQRKGYAYEAALAILDYAKDELCIERIFICMDKNNIPSQALAKKLGFKPYAQSGDGMVLYNCVL